MKHTSIRIGSALAAATLLAQAGVATASTWSPTLLVNTESFQTIDDGDGTTDIELRFGDTANEKLIWDAQTARFEFTDDVHVQGNLTSSGTLTVDGNTILGGTVSITGNATLGGTITIGGVEYTFPGADGSASGKVLKTDGSGQLSWSDDASGSAGLTYSEVAGWFVSDGGDTMTGGLLIQNGGTPGTIEAGLLLEILGTASGRILHAQDQLTSSGTLSVDGATLLKDTTRIDGATTINSTLDTTGSITTDANLTINDDNGGANAVLNFGNDAGAETFQFSDSSNNFELSDDLDVTGTVNTTGNITTDANLTINEDNGDVDAVLTFGNDAGAKAITYSNTNTRFEFNDDIKTTGNLSGSTLTIDGNVTLRGQTYSFPTSAGGSGYILKTNGAGTLQWAPDSGPGSGNILFMQPEYANAIYFASGSTAIGTLSMSGSTFDNENFYVWNSTKATIQDYWVSVRVRVPDNFSKWDATKPIEFRYKTKDGTAATNHVTVRLKDTAGSNVALTGNAGLANAAWTTASITGPQSTGTYTPGGYITVLIKMAATSSGWASASFLEFNWETNG